MSLLFPFKRLSMKVIFSVVPGPAAFTSPGNLLEVQMPVSKGLNQRLWGLDSEICVLTSPPGDPDAHPSWRPTNLDLLFSDIYKQTMYGFISLVSSVYFPNWEPNQVLLVSSYRKILVSTLGDTKSTL